MDYPALARLLPLNNHIYRLTYCDGTTEHLPLYAHHDGFALYPCISKLNEETGKLESLQYNHYVLPYWKLIRVVSVELVD